MNLVTNFLLNILSFKCNLFFFLELSCQTRRCNSLIFFFSFSLGFVRLRPLLFLFIFFYAYFLFIFFYFFCFQLRSFFLTKRFFFHLLFENRLFLLWSLSVLHNICRLNFFPVRVSGVSIIFQLFFCNKNFSIHVYLS